MRLVLALFLVASAARAGDLVGPASCRTCHEEAYRVWSRSAHARAADALSPEQRQRPLCLQCHSREEQRDSQVQVTGVSCETCHGGGRYYQPAVVMRDKELSRLFGLIDPSPATCVVCHGGAQPSVKPFDVKEAMQRIDHWTADREARKKAAASAATPRQDRLALWLKEKR